jgi:heterodisulfide reductase subunit B
MSAPTRKFLLYPGCSLQRNARSYLDSTLALQDILEFRMEEIKDWNCCGATEYTSVHRLASFALEGRNLALAAKQVDGTRTLAAPCSACYLNLAKTEHYMRTDKHLASEVNEALAAGGLNYKPGSVDVRHLLDIFVNDIGLSTIKRKVTHPLAGLRIAPYYGCMIARPDPDRRYDSKEYPTALDRLLKALGAEVIDFPMKAHCCSGHMTQISPKVAYEMIRRLVDGASQYKADLMVTLCPMCQLNLDAYQPEMNRFFNTSYHVPVLYFTQMMGLAFGKTPQELGIGKEFVDARPALARIGVQVPPAEELAAPRHPRKAEGLPMPHMPGDEEVKE